MLHEFLLIAFATFTIASGQGSSLIDLDEIEESRDAVHRQKRFFPLFSVVRFPNSQCTATNNFNGTCFTKRECSYQGGTAFGTCANGFGVCCVFQKSCGSTTNANNTYFTNPFYPTTSDGGDRCVISIQKCNSDICQLRLDFLDFSLAQPTTEGVCDADLLSVTGGSSRVPRICGENTDQHVYVDFEGSNTVTLSIDTSTELVMKRRWNIRIQQIACDSPWRAPSGCLQYFKKLSGTVMSFNYGSANNQRTNDTAPTVMGTREMANLNYGVCIRMASGYCSIRWSKSENNSFTVSGDASTTAEAIGGDTMCLTDYVIIPNTGMSEKFCGTSFDPITTTLKPFVLYVVTDNTETPDDLANRGFSLMFRQMICSI